MTLWVGEVDGLLFDEFIHFFVVAATGVEGRETNDHFVGENTKSPPVNGEAMTNLIKNLRGQIIGSTAERECLSITFKNLCKTKVSQANVTITVEQDILGLQVTVDNLFLMQVTECDGNLDGVETSSLFGESACRTQVSKELTTSDKSHNKEDLLISLEHVVHTNEERMIGLQKNILLKLCALNLVIIDNNILSKTLHGINFTRLVFLLDKEYLAETSSTNNFKQVKVSQCHIFVISLLNKSGSMYATVVGWEIIRLNSSWSFVGLLTLNDRLINIFRGNSEILRRSFKVTCSCVFFRCSKVLALAN
mmetsp:Transcript_94264/g.129853  ORF Transcript_94264/g.129853 Transcript_94264/m.129853 type:complete len:307 (-) Transcript_94264:476-1396(-)